MSTSTVRGGRASRGSPQAITLAARQLFLKRGYEGVNLDTIAKKASVSRQTLYNNFGSKEAIFKAVLNDHWQRIRSRQDAADDVAVTDQTPENMLRIFAERMIGFIDSADQVDFTRLVVAESRKNAWIGREFYEVGKGPLILGFSDTLGRYTDAGLLNCRDPLLAAHQFFGLILECTFWPYVMAIGMATSELTSVENTIEEAIAMFLARYGVT